MSSLYIVAVILIAVTKHVAQGSTAYKCYLEDGRVGKCTPLKQCGVAFDALTQCKLQPDFNCRTGVVEPDVCCPRDPIVQERPLDYSTKVEVCDEISRSRKRIIGMAVNAVPHMAALGYHISGNREYSWLCGGTLIHKFYVLTAAHCVIRMVPKVVLLGTSDLLQPDYLYAQQKEVLEVIKHEYNSKTYFNDIALVRLKESAEFTAYVRPACVLTSKVLNFSNVTTLGWGIGSGDEAYGIKRKILREARMFMCPPHKADVSYLLCAKGTIDAACRGDSGGPLQAYSQFNKRLYVTGVYSHGSRRCSSTTPSYFTRVTLYLDWIEKHIWPKEHCMYTNKLHQ